MKKFLRFNNKEKKFIKMINQSGRGFELIILSESYIQDLLQCIHDCEEKGDSIYIVWQMKFKAGNYILYKNCTFSTPQDNFYSMYGGEPKLFGKKIKVKCSDTNFYTDSFLYKNQKVKKSRSKYSDGMLLNRMLKISELNIKSEEDVSSQ